MMSNIDRLIESNHKLIDVNINTVKISQRLIKACISFMDQRVEKNIDVEDNK